jgi:predicted nucleic acid-binding protein
MNLFIDTNVLLSFYHLTGDDLEELKKLTVLLEQKKLRLYLPSQVVAEFRRNREGKIADALNKLKEQRLNLQFPQICKDYPEYASLRILQKQYETQHAALLNKLNEDVEQRNLKADVITNQLFKLAARIECDDAVLKSARDRADLGNPPGKNGSLGDAANWEALLTGAADKNDLYFVSGDKDYRSALDDESFSDFLADEWERKKKSGIVFYQRISAFFKEKFPHIKLAMELEKGLLVEGFVTSRSFARTHEIVLKLSKYSEFSADEFNRIVVAAINNSQVSSIIDDADIHEFLVKVTQAYQQHIEGENFIDFAMLMSRLGTPLQVDGKELVFEAT